MLAFLWKSFLGRLLLTFLVSIVPIVELRGAVPLGYREEDGPLGLLLIVAVAIVGNMLPVPFIILFIKKVFAFIRRHMPKLDGMITKLENKALSKADTVQKYAFWGLFIFVAVPFPGTGAWTGALIAAMLDMRLKKAVPSIFLGVVTAGIILAILTYLGVEAF